MCETVQVGDEVFDKVYQCSDHPDIVTVKAILPPVLWDDSPEIDKLNEHERKEGGLVIDGGKATHWQNALILTDADGLEGFSRNLEDMEVYTYDAWEAFFVRQAVSDRAREERTGVRRRRKEQRQARDA